MTAFRMAVSMLLMLAAPGLCLAQATPGLTVGAAGGVTTPFSVSGNVSAPAWLVSARGNLTPHLALEGLFEQWQHETTTVYLDQPVYTATASGRAARVEQVSSRRMQTFAANVLATSTSPRIRFSGGGGVGLLLYDKSYGQTTTGCDPSVAQTCGGPFVSRFSSQSMTVQGVADVEVAVTRRLSAFGRYDLILPVRDPSFGHGAVTTGVRVAIW